MKKFPFFIRAGPLGEVRFDWADLDRRIRRWMARELVLRPGVVNGRGWVDWEADVWAACLFSLAAMWGTWGPRFGRCHVGHST